MGARNIVRLLNQAFSDGGDPLAQLRLGDSAEIYIGAGSTDTPYDVQMYWDGTDLKMLPAVDDSTWRIGNGTLSFDVWLYGSVAANYISWDASADRLKLEDAVALHFGTNTAGPGTAGDANLAWDGTQLNLLPAADDSIFKIGNGTLTFDVWIYGSAAANYISWDASADRLKLEDNVVLGFGTNTAGPGTAADCHFIWDATQLNLLAAADDTIFKIGNGTNSFDLWLYGNAASTYVSWDASADRLKFEDNTVCAFGTNTAGPGTAGDVHFNWDGTDFRLVSSTDDYRFLIGNGTNSMDVIMYGNIASTYVEWDASADQLALRGAGRPLGFHSNISKKYELRWTAGMNGKPGINADIQDSTESVRQIADPHFEVLGTNGDTSTVTFNPESGIILTTKTSTNDQVIIAPHLDTSQTSWTQTTWGTDQSTTWECLIKTGANITAVMIWAGLKITNTSTTTTDNDQVFFRYQDTVNSGKWQAIDSIANSDTATDSAVTVAISTVYHLKIDIASSRVAKFYINGVLVKTSSALTDATDLIPYIGVQTTTTAAKTLTVYGQGISRTPA